MFGHVLLLHNDNNVMKVQLQGSNNSRAPQTSTMSINVNEYKELPPLPQEMGKTEVSQHPPLNPTFSTPEHRNSKPQIVSQHALRGSTDSFIRQKEQNSAYRVEGLSSRRAGPTLTLNLHSNNNKPPVLDFPLISPVPFSASSAEDCNFLTSNEDGDSPNVEKSRPPLLALRSVQVNAPRTKIVLTQQTPTNIISTRQMSESEPNKKIEVKSLNRRNYKKLSLGPIITDVQNKPGDSPIAQMGIKDPERKIDTDALIENIKNLEFGLEYEMPINADELIALKKLGSGQSGTVSKVLHLPTQKTMARKIVHLEAKEIVQSQIMRELRIMHECDSPFIIEFYGTFLQEGNVVICMEYADCGSLAHVFKLTGPFPEFMLKHVAYSVLSGLIYLYDQHRIIHRDVKPSNVLLTSKGKIKLCDFGVSRELINSMADTFVGTSTYMSPERIQGGVYSVKGDVWSLGIMLYELASGKLAFANDNSGAVSILELLQRIVNEQPPSLSVKDGFSSEISDFVSLCLKKESLRPSPSDLMNHRFLADFLDDDGIIVSSKYRADIRKWSKNVRRVQKGKPVKD